MHLCLWIVSPMTGFYFPKSLSPRLVSSSGWNHLVVLDPPAVPRGTCWPWWAGWGGRHPLSPTSWLGTGYQFRYKLLPGNYYQSFTHKGSDVLEQTWVVFNSSFIGLVANGISNKTGEEAMCVLWPARLLSPIPCSLSPLKIPNRQTPSHLPSHAPSNPSLSWPLTSKRRPN